MRRFAVTSLLVATLLVAAAVPAGALRAAPAFCPSFDRFVRVMQNVEKRSELRGTTYRAARAALRDNSTGATGRAVRTFTDALDTLSHGKRSSLSKKVQHRADRALTAVARAVVARCPAKSPGGLFASAMVTAAGAKAAQTDLRNGITVAKALYADSDTYAAATPDALGQGEPSLQFRSGAVTRHHEISVHVVAPQEIVMAAARDGQCWFIRDRIESGTDFGATVADSCDATAPPGSWSSRW